MQKELKKKKIKMNFFFRKKIKNGFFFLKPIPGTSLVVQWLRVCLPMQGMLVGSLCGN